MENLHWWSNYYSEFVIKYAVKARRLTVLTSYRKAFELTEEAWDAFDLFTDDLFCEPVLALLDYERMVYLVTLTSDVVISGLFGRSNRKKTHLKIIVMEAKSCTTWCSRNGKNGRRLYFVSKHSCFLVGKKCILRVETQLVSLLKPYSLDKEMKV